MENMNNSTNISGEKIDELYNGRYIKDVHKIGTTIMLTLMVVTFIPAFYVSFVLGYFPGWGLVSAAFATTIGMNFFYWFLEPVIYFPMIGITGVYIGYVSGNVSTIRIPAALAAQSAIDAEAGTKKAEFAGVLGMVSSVVVNFIVLGIVIFAGAEIIKIMPPVVEDSLQFALPGLYGALVFILAARLKK